MSNNDIFTDGRLDIDKFYKLEPREYVGALTLKQELTMLETQLQAARETEQELLNQLAFNKYQMSLLLDRYQIIKEKLDGNQ